MRIVTRIALPTAIALAWLIAAMAPFAGPWPAAISAFIVVLLVPGYTVDRALGIGTATDAYAAELPARVFTLSVALVGVLGAGCAFAEASMRSLLVALCTLSIALAWLPSREKQQPQDRERGDRPRLTAGVVIVFAAVAVLTAVMVTAAAATENIARDRMWYMAYVGRLADADVLSWREPLLGTGRVVPRFAYNAWITSMAAWKAMASSPPAFLFSRVGPVLLTALVASSALALARALFGRGLGAAVPTFTTLLVYLTTRFPFFSPTRYPLFGRLVEDKSVALIVLLPVAVALALDTMANVRRLGNATRPILWLAVALAFTAVALSHPLVFLLLLITVVPLAVLIASRSGAEARRQSLAVAVLAVTIALVPTWLGFAARRDIIEAPVSADLFTAEPTDPVVRSHIRMNRTTEIGFGGPIVDPRLLAEPLLLLALAGVVVLLRRRRSEGEAFLLMSTLSCTSLAFLPFVAPSFGRLVVPWMAYRALWGIPFGPLLGILVLAAAKKLQPLEGRGSGPLVVLLILLTALAWPRLPWPRLSMLAQAQPTSRLMPDQQTKQLLAEISKLHRDTKIAAAPPLAELIAGYTAHSVLAFSDRGTVVFSASRDEAERRLEANAALIGLVGGSRRLRNRIVGAYDITHTVYQDRGCDRKAATIYQSPRFALCAERAHPPGRGRLSRVSAVASKQAHGALVAPIGKGLRCRPGPMTNGDRGRYRWQRSTRWSGKPITVTCSARFAEEVQSLVLRIAMRLPRAREALVYRIVTRGGETLVRRQGVIEFRENPYAEIKVPGYRIKSVRLRLSPAYLPYLNLDALELRAAQ